jgi:hypothetical protein
MPAQQQGLRFFFPSTAKLVTAEAHGDGGRFPGTAPQMTAQFIGPKNDVQKPSSIQVVEIYGRVFHLVGLSRALIDEAPHRFRLSHTQAMRLLHFVVALKLRIANRDKMPPAKHVPVKLGTGSLVTVRDTAMFSVPHYQRARSGCITISTIPLCRTIGQPSLWCQALASFVRFLVRQLFAFTEIFSTCSHTCS